VAPSRPEAHATFLHQEEHIPIEEEEETASAQNEGESSRHRHSGSKGETFDTQLEAAG
jgi:hypothetical protein